MKRGQSLLVDGHVHFHACFTWGMFLDGAAARFARARRELHLPDDSPGCLMFAESAGINAYGTLRDQPALVRGLGWEVAESDDACSIVLSRNTRETMVIVAGRQIVTAERLEVLALGCIDECAEGQPTHDVLHAIVDRGALAVIPWGLGKWLGRRGTVVRRLLEGRDVPFCLGDNGGRARLMPRPALLGRAERHGVPVLGGSDPLPLPNQVTRAGSYGFVLDGWRGTLRPFQAIRTRVEALRQSPPVFGELSSLPGMVRAQLGIRWQRHRVGAGDGAPVVA